MAWPHEKGTATLKRIPFMSDEELRQRQNSLRRLDLANLCRRCKVVERTSKTSLYCKNCWNECYLKNKPKYEMAQKRRKALEYAAQYNGVCMRCEAKLKDPITEKLRVRLVCKSCAAWVMDQTQSRFGKRFRIFTQGLVVQYFMRHNLPLPPAPKKPQSHKTKWYFANKGKR